MNIHHAELNRYHRLNSTILPDCAVFFGSSCFAGIPIGELAHDLFTDIPVYNRSIDGLSLTEAEEALNECVCSLKPSKVFINLGEEDLLKPDFDLHTFITGYEWLLYTLNNRLNGKSQIFIVSIVSPHARAACINTALEKLAHDTGCTYVDITRAAASENTEVRIFEILRRFLRGHTIHFSEAFQINGSALI